MAFSGLTGSLNFRRQLPVISKSSSNIKPASPTPSKLKRYNIPLHDRMVPGFYCPIILFYPSYNSDHSLKLIPNNTSLSDQLKKSLSETLSKYYPFAGRLSSSGTYVDCNDQGVHFVEAQIGCKLWEVLEKAPVMEEEEGLGHLFPPRTIWNQTSEMYSGIIMHVQLNHFTCGGIAIAISLHHQLADALTQLSFLRYWATLSLHSGDHQKLLHLCPHLVNELLPHCDGDSVKKPSYPDKNWTTNEVVFLNTKLAKLKAVVENEDKLDGVVQDQKYTRNELLTALLYRCLVAAAAETNIGADNGSVLIRSINVRSMMDPPLPKTSVGNFAVTNCIPTSTESETKYRTLVAKMRKEMRQLKGIKNFDGHEVEPKLLELSKNNYKFYSITSICNFPVYEVMDFGWGKPIKVTIVDVAMVNVIILMDTANDGVRAIVGLGEQDMKNFLGQKELLNYGVPQFKPFLCRL